ncbi:MAG: phenylalanine--tRNA ligase subunit beta [wastewater metagenome]|nr:phenylalanine--tRNA ligase subunit beta [Candidatus Loosdrechtia aerotolerans]
MKISYNWLKEYAYFYLSPQELADKLTNAGLVVADIKPKEDDFFLEIEITSNRPDCLGMIGIAREVTAAVGGSLHLPDTDFETGNTDITNLVTVSVEDPLLCPRYTARVVRNVTVRPSPEWLQKRLLCIGLRPVNNIVDITNYVMFETGQPLHAFDLDKVPDRRVVVRKASNGEKITTINGAQRVLFHTMLVVADSKKPIAVAGIMGGKETEVSESTRDILLECAHFEPRQVRRTSKELGITSDSSYRFERGTDLEGVEFASKRAAKLMKDLADGEIAGEVVDIRSRKCKEKMITLRVDRLHTVLGVEIKRDVASDILRRLQFTIAREVNNFIDVTVPSFRRDIDREIDLIEEIARVYGYNNIPTKTSIHIRSSGKTKYEIAEDCIRQCLTGLGFYEIKTYSIVDTSSLQSMHLWSDKEPIDIANPLRQEESRLRMCLLPNLINVKRYNANYGVERVRIFEIARVYLAGDTLPHEKTCLSVITDADFYSLKGILELLLQQLGIPSKGEWTPFKEPKLFKDERAAQVFLDGRVLGYLGEASKELEFKTQTSLLELDVDLLIESANFTKKYQVISQYPSVIRDLAIIIDERVAWSSIEQCIADIRIPFFKGVNFFDIYRGKQIPEGQKSVAFSLCFQAQDRTLKGEEVDIAVQTALDTLREKLGAELRKI